MATLEGQQLGPYQVIAQMGSGGMATVYKAYHARLDRFVAIKVMHEAFQQDENFLARFEREAQIVARLEHPNIVPVYDFSEIEGRPYLVMKFIEGQTLKASMLRHPPTLDDIRRILPPIADALDYAHRQGILHRDIKPSNIILDTAGVPYLTDFGLARIAQLGESTLSQDVVLGTPQYISPEQAMGKRDLTPATDLYSLGVVLYELVVGRVPFSSDTPFATIHDHIYRALPLPSQINPDLTPQIDTVLDKALAKRPEDRFTSAAEMVRAFLAAIENSNLHDLNPERGEIAAASLAKARQDIDDDARTTPLPVEDRRSRKPLPQNPTVPLPADAGADDAEAYDEEDEDDQRQRVIGLRIPQPPAPPRPPGMADVPKRKVEVSLDLGSVDWSQIGRRVENVIQDVAESVEQAVDKSKVDVMLANDPDSIRRRVEQQMKKRNEFVGHLIAFIMVNALLWVIFFAAAGSSIVIDNTTIAFGAFPWPLLVFFGWGSGLLAHAVETFFETGRRLRRRVEAVERDLIRAFGEDWSRTADKKQIKAIRRRAEKPFKEVSGFYQHFVVYVMINLMLWFLYFSVGNAIQLPGDVANIITNAPFPWPLVVSIAWGIGLVINAFQALTAGSYERAVQREVAREESRLLARGEKPKRIYDPAALDIAPPRARISADGEFTDSMVEELDDDGDEDDEDYRGRNRNRNRSRRRR